MTDHEQRTWQVVHVEDDPDMLRQMKEFLEDETFNFGNLHVVDTNDFDKALALLAERKVDLVILDVYRGSPDQENSAGLSVLEKWRSIGFAPVILHTALPEKVEEHKSIFVRLVPKEEKSLPRIKAEIEDLFTTNLPQIHRAMVDHLDGALRSYMWTFVPDHWEVIQPLACQSDFVRLLLRRLALEFTKGVAPTIESLYPGSAAVDPDPDKIHPVEYYVKPPIGKDPQLGDVRKLSLEKDEALFVTVWPSCDLVHRKGKCKVDRALCARARPIEEFPEHMKWSKQPSNTAKEELVELLENNRKGGQAERFHFLPAAWDIPAVVVDFDDLQHVAVGDLCKAPCLATVASPFAEAMATRFVRYLARIGTPDLDMDIVFKGLPTRTPRNDG